MSIPSPHFEFDGSHRTQHSAAAAPAQGAEEELSWLLLRSAERLIAALEPHVALAELNQARFQVLEALETCDEDGCSQTQLADELLLSESNLSTLVERMGDDGLVSRRRSESDRRKTVIRLTDTGAAALARAISSRRDALRQLMSEFNESEAEMLCTLLRRILERLDHHLLRQGRRRNGFQVDTRTGKAVRRSAVPAVQTTPESSTT